MVDTNARLRVVAVHGVGYHDPRRAADAVRHANAADWTGHLARGLGIEPERLNVAFAYYAPALNATARRQGSDDELADELAAGMLADWLAELGAPTPVAQGALTLPLRQAASWIAEHFGLDGRLTHLFIRVFFREVATYLRTPDSEARGRARRTVEDLIAEHQPDVVIAHSLGTVVSYEALHTKSKQRVPLLLTLGSPLALPKAVFPRLQPSPTQDGAAGREMGFRPPGVERWVNIADPGDPVAIPPRLAKAFHGVTLDLPDTVHATYGFHHARNYLACAATAATLAPYLGL